MRLPVSIVALIAGLGLSACAYGPEAEAEVRTKAWEEAVEDTDVTTLGGDRLRLVVRAGAGDSTLEKRALMRAAGETIKAGKPRFVFTYVDYHEGAFADFMAPDLGEATSRWIGTYEDLLEARDAADLDGSLNGPFARGRLEAVVLMLPAEETAGRRESFEARETYEAMLDDIVIRQGIRPDLRFDARQLRLGR